MSAVIVDKKRAWMHANEKFICVETYSGHGITTADPEGKMVFVDPNPEPVVLGQALHEALAVSRLLPLEEIGKFFDRDALKTRYEEWIAQTMQKFSYKKRRDMFRRMKSCGVEACEGILTFSPLHHEKPEAWSGDKDIEDVILKEPVSMQELGESALLALSRCTGP